MALVTKTFSDIITFTRASTATFFNSSGVLTSAAINVPRFDYNPATLAAQGLLIEESRTNSIRNNTMQGAVAGTPGTLPTNWVQSSLGTLTQQVVGTGTENGVTYLDIRYSGTTSNTLITLQFDANTQIAAATGQSWTSSFWAKEAGGSQTNITSISHRIRELDVGGTALATGTQTITVNTTLSRNTFSRTLINASTAFIANQIAIAFASGVAIDITLRIGLPQLELGAFATSVIPTTVIAATRSADVASVNTLSPWFNAAEGTVYVEWDMYSFNAGLNYRATLDDGTSNNSLRMRLSPSGTTLARHDVVNSGVATTLGSPATINLALTKEAMAFAANDYAGVVNGGAAATSSTLTLPTPTRLSLGSRESNSSFLNGHLRRITYYPRRLSNAELVSITS